MPTRARSLLAAVALLALLVACADDEDGQAIDEGTADGSSQPADPSPSEAAPDDSGAPEWAPGILTEGDDVVGLDFSDTPEPGPELQVATVVEGEGPPVEAGQTLTVDYLGAVYGGEAPFDESYSAQPATFPIGTGNLIPGWDQGIPGIPVGSRVIMSIPPDLGYGAQEVPGIPAGSTLYFVLDILEAA